MSVLIPDSIADSEIVYFGFRTAFVALIDEMMGEALKVCAENAPPRLFLERFALLDSMAPQVQLECLLNSWDRLRQRKEFRLLDECVCLAALDLLADLAGRDAQPLLRMAWAGPRQTSLQLDHWVSSWARAAEIALIPSRRTWLLDMVGGTGAETCARLLQLSEDQLKERDDLLSLIGRWRVSPEVQNTGSGLITEAERELMQAFFEEHPGLLGEADASGGL